MIKFTFLKDHLAAGFKIVLEHQEHWKPRDQVRGSHDNLGGSGDGWDRAVTVVARSGPILDVFQAEPTGFPYRLNVPQHDRKRGVKDDSRVFVKNVLEGWSCYLISWRRLQVVGWYSSSADMSSWRESY